MMQIEKNVPLPLSGKVIGLLLGKMVVRDSVLLPGFNASVKNSLHSQMRKLGPQKRFITRTEGDNVRVWRLE